MSDRLQPQTAREALFEIRRLSAGVHVDTDASELACEIDCVALEGLQRAAPVNFELTDQLTDRLAEAHTVLREVDREGWADNTDLENRVSETLVLPTDLETMVERRIGPRR